MNVLFVFAIIVLFVVLYLLFSRKEIEKNSEEKPFLKKQQVTVAPSSKSAPKKKNEINGHEYVDLGLPSGTLWATCNVGAEKPEEYGNYYAWGEVEPKSYYNWSREGNYKWGTSKNTYPDYGMTKYNITDGKYVLDPEDDAATANWGGNWIMPTKAEQDELRNNFTWTWTTDYNGTGKAGYIVSSKAEGNTNSIFLPVAGGRYDSSLNFAGSRGGYWSSSLDAGYPSDPGSAYYVFFDSGNYDRSILNRFYGLSVRAVCSPK